MGYAWFTHGKEAEERNGGVNIGADDVFFAEVDSDVDSNLFEAGVWGNKGKEK